MESVAELLKSREFGCPHVNTPQVSPDVAQLWTSSPGGVMVAWNG
jgi:hypothetical protein